MVHQAPSYSTVACRPRGDFGHASQKSVSHTRALVSHSSEHAPIHAGIVKPDAVMVFRVLVRAQQRCLAHMRRRRNSDVGLPHAAGQSPHKSGAGPAEDLSPCTSHSGSAVSERAYALFDSTRAGKYGPDSADAHPDGRSLSGKSHHGRCTSDAGSRRKRDTRSLLYA